jgi:hypothetical protein
LGISIPWVATIQIAVPDGNSRRILKTREEARIKSPTSSPSFTLLKCSKWGGGSRQRKWQQGRWRRRNLLIHCAVCWSISARDRPLPE